jgi:hypothetical protein
VRPRYVLNFPDHNEFDLADADQADEYFSQRNRQLQLLMEEMKRTVNNPQYITVENKSIQQTIREQAAWPGIMWYFDGSLAEARREARKRGWTVQDGQGGSVDLRHRFLRGAGAREDAGDTGGAEAASVDIAGAIANHGNHYHYDSGGFGPSDCVAVDNNGEGSTICVATYDHTHGYGKTGGGKDCVGGGTDFLSHSNDSGNATVPTVPPFYEAIVLRKD